MKYFIFTKGNFMKRFIFTVLALSMTAPAFADNPHNQVVVVEKIVQVPVPFPVERKVYITEEDNHDELKGAIVGAAITWAIMHAVRKHRRLHPHHR